MTSSSQSAEAPHNFRSVKSSQVVLKELMIPSYANFGGKVHGGIILSLMDKIAYTAAATHSRGYCVTASVDSVNFVNSVNVGELVTLMASVNYVGRSSMEVGIKVVSQDFKRGIEKHTNTSYFTMVAIDETTRESIPVPGLILENDKEIERFIWGKFRKQYKLDYKKQFHSMQDDLDMSREKQKLLNENCFVKSPNKSV
ncbi:acyl-CoA thioesterase [Glaciecola siphonariae]|uniref:Acyl-CoA thioesterase n=1 Tax=Glaciecola siphonariae TaxID=521012 RepID=A0ABV9LQV1_9ALTE